MNVKVGQRTYAPPRQTFLQGVVVADRIQAAEGTAREIDLAVPDIIAEAFDRATAILKARRVDLDWGSEMLLRRETVTADEFPAIRPVATDVDEAEPSVQLRGMAGPGARERQASRVLAASAPGNDQSIIMMR